MHPVRRHDLSPRIEMTPMIDVIFLLLTFFIYSMVLMIRAEVLPVALTSFPGTDHLTQGAIHTLTIDRKGAVFYNRQRVDFARLDQRLSTLAAQDPQPKLFLALEAEGDVDRAPRFIDLLQRVRRAGVKDFAIVGQPSP